MNCSTLRAAFRAAPELAGGRRSFSSSSLRAQEKLRIGYVPEHFATPLHFAQDRFGLANHASSHPFPSGTGTLIEAFNREEIDVGIGLTESWVAGMARDHARSPMASKKEWQRFHISSSYVESPLRWAISTGAKRADVTRLEQMQHRNVGVSRLGSGSHIMAMVLADQQKWFDPSGAPPFQVTVCGPFAQLREAVQEGRADAFMWEHYTTKKFWDNGELKSLGEIPTPWNGWHIAVRGSQPNPKVHEHLYPALQKGIEHLRNDKEDTVEFIASNMDYSRADAEAWYDEVQFTNSIGRINSDGIGAAIKSLRTSGFIQGGEATLQDFESINSKGETLL